MNEETKHPTTQDVVTEQDKGRCAPASCSAAELELALNASLNLQRHYAKLLNHWDGGKRFLFRDAEEWIARLRKVGTLPPNAEIRHGGPETHD